MLIWSRDHQRFRARVQSRFFHWRPPVALRSIVAVDEAAGVQHTVPTCPKARWTWGLRVICVECGAETAAAAQSCVECGTPAVGQPSGLASGHTVEGAGATHTFRSHRGIRMAGVIALAAMLVIVCGATIAHGPQGGFNVWVKIAFIAGFVVPSAWFAVRWFRLGAEISSGRMTVRNLWRTRVIAIDEIHRIDLAAKRGDHASPPHWFPLIHLTNGDSVWIDGFSCGIAQRPPDPGGLAALGELRALIGLQAIT